MKSPWAVLVLAVLAAGTAGCSDTMRSYLEKDAPPAEPQAAVRQDLTMPPDLSLAPPGSAPAAPAAEQTYASNAGGSDLSAPPSAASPAQAAPAAPVKTAAATPRPSPADSVYEKAGISLTKPDGTRKTQGELQAEYKKWYVAQKRAQNPNYGTVMNIGDIFKDE